MGKVREPQVQFDGRQLVQAHGPHRPVRIVLHDTESHDAAGISDIAGIANFFKAQGLGYGSHLVIDADGNTGRLVDDREIGWHVGGRNTGSLGIEQIGFAKFTKGQWASRGPQLEKVARWIAWWTKRYGIPLAHDVDRGVSTHADQSRAFHTTDHTDPGGNYPLDAVLARAHVLRGTGW